jgi:hypothetical protein
MLVMSGAFGLWRAGLISNALFAVGIAAVVLALLGGTTWLSSGFWAPDGAYSRFVSPIIGLVWILGVSRILLTRSLANTCWMVMPTLARFRGQAASGVPLAGLTPTADNS